MTSHFLFIKYCDLIQDALSKRQTQKAFKACTSMEEQFNNVADKPLCEETLCKILLVKAATLSQLGYHIEALDEAQRVISILKESRDSNETFGLRAVAFQIIAIEEALSNNRNIEHNDELVINVPESPLLNVLKLFENPRKKRSQAKMKTIPRDLSRKDRTTDHYRDPCYVPDTNLIESVPLSDLMKKLLVNDHLTETLKTKIFHESRSWRLHRPPDANALGIQKANDKIRMKVQRLSWLQNHKWSKPWSTSVICNDNQLSESKVEDLIAALKRSHRGKEFIDASLEMGITFKQNKVRKTLADIARGFGGKR